MPEKKTNKLLKFLSYFGGAISYLLELAAVATAILEDWIDFGILVFVLVANAIIGYHEEAKAENALDALKNTLALKCRVWRNARLVELDSSLLVPGDVIVLRLGDIVPADARYDLANYFCSAHEHCKKILTQSDKQTFGCRGYR